MKKLVYMFAIVLSMTFLAGCAANETNKSQENKETVSSLDSIDLEKFSDVAKNKPVEDYVTLGDYKGLEVTIAKTVATQEEIDTLAFELYIEEVEANSSGIKDRAIQEGDTANIDYVGKKDGKAFDGGTAEGYNLGIGTGTFIPGFEEGLIGVKPGETVDINLSFPENYQATELAGQAVVFTVTVNYIMPEELDEKIIADFGNENYSNIKELNAYAKEILDAENEVLFQSEAESAILNTFISNATFREIPQEIVDSQKKAVQAMLDIYEYYYGITAESYAKFYGMDVETFIETQAKEFAKQQVVCQAVANVEGLNISDRELEEMLIKNASAAGAPSVEDFLGHVDREEYRDSLLVDKVCSFIIENASIKAE